MKILVAAGINTTLRIFERYGDQACNRLLKRIAVKAKIEMNLHNHVGAIHLCMLVGLGWSESDVNDEAIGN